MPWLKISIQYPAKLIEDGRVIRDMFPGWRKAMRMSRLGNGNSDNSRGRVQSNAQVHLFASETEWSDIEETESDYSEPSEQRDPIGSDITHAHMDTNRYAPLLGEATRGEGTEEDRRDTSGSMPNGTGRDGPPDHDA